MTRKVKAQNVNDIKVKTWNVNDIKVKDWNIVKLIKFFFIYFYFPLKQSNPLQALQILQHKEVGILKPPPFL